MKQGYADEIMKHFFYFICVQFPILYVEQPIVFWTQDFALRDVENEFLVQIHSRRK
jgi:hypothetical protein